MRRTGSAGCASTGSSASKTSGEIGGIKELSGNKERRAADAFDFFGEPRRISGSRFQHPSIQRPIGLPALRPSEDRKRAASCATGNPARSSHFSSCGTSGPRSTCLAVMRPRGRESFCRSSACAEASSPGLSVGPKPGGKTRSTPPCRFSGVSAVPGTSIR